MDDPDLLKFTRVIRETFVVSEGPVKILDLYPWIIPFVPNFIKNGWMKCAYIEELTTDIQKFCEVKLSYEYNAISKTRYSSHKLFDMLYLTKLLMAVKFIGCRCKNSFSLMRKRSNSVAFLFLLNVY